MMRLSARSLVLVLLVAMASAVPAAPGGVDTRIGKLEKKIAALVAMKAEGGIGKQVRRAPRSEACEREREALLPRCAFAHPRLRPRSWPRPTRPPSRIHGPSRVLRTPPAVCHRGLHS